MRRKTIGIIGAGVMGTGVAQSFLSYDYNVILIDLNDEILFAAKKKILQGLKYYNHLLKESMLPDDEKLSKQITLSTNYKELVYADVIIENVTENFDVKKEVYKQIYDIVTRDHVIGVNTSAFPITKIASLTRYPQNVIGIHFMNPVPVKRTVEVVKGIHTSTTTIETTNKLLESINKKSVVIEDTPGFITNRTLMIFINEAVFALQEGIATVEQIDLLCKECFGHKMGPLQTADLIGIDTLLNSLVVLYESYKDPKYRPCALLDKMVYAGYLGVKSGRGFYNYE